MQFSPIEIIQMQVTPLVLRGEKNQVEFKVDILMGFYPLLLAMIQHEPLKAIELRRRAYPMIEDVFSHQNKLQDSFLAQFKSHVSRVEIEIILSRCIGLVLDVLEQQLKMDPSSKTVQDYLYQYVDEIWDANSYMNRLILSELGIIDPKKQQFIMVERNGLQDMSGKIAKFWLFGAIGLAFILLWLGEAKIEFYS